MRRNNGTLNFHISPNCEIGYLFGREARYKKILGTKLKALKGKGQGRPQYDKRMVQTLLLLLLSVYVGYSVTSAKEGDGGAYYYANWCNQHELEYLDDRLCQKVFPSYTSSDSRSFTCSVSPTSRSSAEAMGYVPEAPFSAASRVDTSTLLHHVSEKLHESVRLCMSLVRRVVAQEGVGGQDDVQLYTKYVCLGEASVSDAYETWSSSKVFAAAFAAGELRSARTRSEARQEG